MSTQIITIANRKGGVGKTTTAFTLGARLSQMGYKTLLIDLDSQCNLTISTNTPPDITGTGQLLRGEASLNDVIRPVTDNLYIIAGGADLARADTELTETGSEFRLKEALSDKAINDFDYVVLDCPPSLNVLTINALTASNHLVILAQADLFSLQALTDLNSTLELVKKYTNPDITTDGILLTRYNGRTILSREIENAMKETAEKMNTKVFNTKIREGVAVKEAQVLKQDLFTYKPNANVTKDYESFVDELLESLQIER